MAKLTYGIRNGKLYHVDDVEQGLKCECICPNCKENLIARQGDINEHHFAHASNECDITKAQESALHFMAKEILAEYKIIKLPKIKIHSKSAFLPKKEFKDIDNKVNKDKLIYKYENGEEQVLKFNKVYLEQQENNIIPDLVCEYESGKLFIEIAVTNFVNELKSNKIKELNIPTIEIDLSEYRDKIETLTKRRLSDILIDDVELKKWIYNPLYQQDINIIVDKNINEINNQLEIINKCCDMFKPENYLVNQSIYNDSKHAMNFWRKQNISNQMKMPWFIGYPIYGDFIFEVDRRIWQGFIVNLIANSKFPTSPHSIWKYSKTKEFLRIDPNFLEPIWISDTYKYSGLEVIKQYYEFLQDNNIINERGLLIYGK